MDHPSAAVTDPWLMTNSGVNESTAVGSHVVTTEKPVYTYTLFIIAGDMLRYVPPFILVLGFFGNIMTIAIMRRMKSGDSTINLYFIALAASDLMYLFVAVLWGWVQVVFGFRFNATHAVACKMTTWLYTGGMVISAWLLVCMTVHRALSVVWPHRVSVLCTRRRVRLLILGIVVFFAVTYSHYLFGANAFLYLNGGHYCFIHSDNKIYMNFLTYVFTYIDLAFYSLLPFIIMAVSNTVLIWKLSQSVKAAGKVLSQGDAEQVQAREKAARTVTVTVVVVSVTFLVLTLPGSLNYIINFFDSSKLRAPGFQQAMKHFISASTTLLGDLNTAINFYLYCLTGRRFREEFIKILCCGRNRRRRGAHQ